MWQTAQCPLRAWRMGKRDRRHGRRQRSCAPGWTPGNASIFSLCQSASLCFSLFPSFSQEHRIKLCQDIFFFFFFMSDKEMESGCYVHPGCLQGNTDELNLWPLSVIGQQNCKSICSAGPRLSPVKSFPPNCCRGIAKSEAFFGVQDVC